MGANQSKPDSDSTKHVFTASAPINFSPELIDSLQVQPETNSTRAKTLDLHIAQRVAAELERLQAKESKVLEDLTARISRGEELASEAADKAKSGVEEAGEKVKSKLPEALGGESKAEKDKKSASSQKVADEIEKLKQQLGQRKVLGQLPKEVEAAREGVISCLRLNDRRPLDCWKEVEVFKREVKKLEDEFVSKVL